MESRYNAPIGTPGNAWANQAVGSNGTSLIIDTWSCPFISIYGHSSGATTITVSYSPDQTNFYAAHTITLSGAGDFAADYQAGARYIQLASSGAVTLTATIQAK